MNVEIGAEAAQFPEKEYINGIAVAVWEKVFPRPALSKLFPLHIYLSTTLFFSLFLHYLAVLTWTSCRKSWREEGTPSCDSLHSVS
jgi:hypothetical protein